MRQILRIRVPQLLARSSPRSLSISAPQSVRFFAPQSLRSRGLAVPQPVSSSASGLSRSSAPRPHGSSAPQILGSLAPKLFRSPVNQEGARFLSSEGPQVLEVNESNFFPEVIEASEKEVVILDCYADWCGPCKDLTPRLEAAVRAAGPGVRLAKLNADTCQEISAQLKVESLPTVFLIVKGKIADKVVGNMNDEQLKAFMDKIPKGDGKPTAEDLVKMAQEAQNQANIPEALQLYGQVLQMDKEGLGHVAMSGMILCALSVEDLSGAQQLAETLKTTFKNQLDHASVKQALTALELAGETLGGGGADMKELQAAVESDANNHEARRKLAIVLFAAQEYTAAMDHALQIIKRDKEWEDQGGKKLLFQFFDTLGNAHPEVTAARKKLAVLMF